MTGTKDETERHTESRRSRRTDEDRIKELEAKIAEIRVREESKKRREDPVQREARKLQARLRKYAQLAAESDRLDIANSVTAWVASLERMVRDDRLRPARLKLDEEEPDQEA